MPINFTPFRNFVDPVSDKLVLTPLPVIIIIIIIIIIIFIINTLFEIGKIYMALQKIYSPIYTNLKK